jgi:hypothetical protein
LALVAVLVFVPAATRAGQMFDPSGKSHQASGFSHAGTLPPDPVLVPAVVPIVVTVIAMVVPIPAEWIGPADVSLPASPPAADIRSPRAPPVALTA